MHRSPAFTLIELLVVITIIVVLLALLTPALDQAIYQAELTVCGAQMKTIATGVTTGAMERNRYYPGREGMNSPHMVVSGADTRPVLRQYLGVSTLRKILTDPFCEEGADLDAAPAGRNTYGTYWMFFGWQYTTADGGAGMKRVGDRWTWKGVKYDVLVQDQDVVQGNTQQWMSHPDADGVTQLVHHDDILATVSAWYAQTDNRGLVDLNYAFADCSVTRYPKVTKLSNQPGAEATDERMVQVPNFVDGGNQMGMVPKTSAR